MTWLDAIWLVLGLATGVVHAAGIRRSTDRFGLLAPLWAMLRLSIVGLTLAAAAFWGGILPAAAGWALGFLFSILLLVRRRVETREGQTPT